VQNISVKPHLYSVTLETVANQRKPASLEMLFSALADRTRLRLLNLIAKQEICVCYFVEALNLPQPKISRHLAYLRKVGIVAARREGKWMHYRLVTPSDSHAATILKTTLRAFRKNKEIQQDFVRLNNACMGPRSLVQILGAPRPASMRPE
jgi:ArsR family transcriptional regulator, arsenate/arsenite/antimonite-responsive transcriptional repressor